MATFADLEKIGYVVGLAFVGEDGVSVLGVSGEGLRTYIRADDHAAIDSLANPAPEPPAVVEPSLAADIPALDPKTATLADVIARVNELTG